MAKKSKAEVESEYQDVLKVSQSMVAGIKRLLDGTEKTQSKISKGQLAQNIKLKSILSSITKYEDINEAILKVDKVKANVSNRYWGMNKKLISSKKEELSVITDILKLEKDRGAVISQVDTIASDLGNSMNGILDEFLSKVGSVPVLGDIFTSILNGPVNKLKSGLTEMSQQFTVGFTKSFSQAALTGGGTMKAFATSTKAGFASMTASAATFWTVAMGPVGIAIAAIAAVVAVLAMGVIRMTQIDDAVHRVEGSTGLLHSQLHGVGDMISTVHANTAGLGASFEDVSSAVSDYSNAFEGTQAISKEVLNSMVVLNKNFGVSTETASKLNRVFQNIGELTAEQSQHLIGQTVELAKQSNVAPDKVIEDIATNSGIAYTFFKGNVKELAKAAVEARRLGTNIGDLAKTAETLLDFEGSITDELEAGAMMGTNFNFQQARTLAYSGNLLDMQKSILDEIQAKTDITKLDIFQQKALAKASGMEFEDLNKQIEVRKRFGSLGKENLATALALFDAGEDISKITKHDLEIQTAQNRLDQDRQTRMETMMNSLKSVGSTLMDAFMPLGELLINVLIPVIKTVMAIFTPLITQLGNSFKRLLEPFDDLFGGKSTMIFMTALKLIAAYFIGPLLWGIHMVLDIIDGIVTSVVGIFNVFKGIGQVIQGIATGDMKLLNTGFENIFGGITTFFDGLWEILISPFTALIETVRDIFGDVFIWIGNQFKDIVPDWIMNWLAGGGSITQTVKNEMSPGGAGKSTAGSIHDGIVQNGKIISTNPKDTLIATQTPETLLNGTAPVNNYAVDNSELISKMDEMIAAIRGGKDVFLDKEKVTNSIMKQREKSNGNIFGLGVA